MIRVYENEDITKYYIEFRPKYQDCVVEEVLRFCNENPASKTDENRQQVMVDVACGSGQATTQFQKHFEKIIGVDVSPNQIKEARLANDFENISYKVGAAEEIPVESGSVDLLISATACHRFDFPKFFKEAKRVLKPDGCMALFSYAPRVTPMNVEDPIKREELADNATNLLLKYHRNPTDEQSNIYCFGKYQDIYEKVPAKNKKWIKDGLVMKYDWSLSQLLGYLRSNAAYQEYMKMMKEKNKNASEDEVKKWDRALMLRDFIKREWKMEGVSDDNVMMQADFSVFVVLANKLTV